MKTDPIQVLVVDDSATVRQSFLRILEKDSGFAAVVTAQDPLYARQKLEQRWPDVIVLDIEMPRMDGLTFLRSIMEEKPTPVVICSSLAENGSDIALKALEFGAVDIITKPKMGIQGYLVESAEEIRRVLKAAAGSRSRVSYRIAQGLHPEGAAGTRREGNREKETRSDFPREGATIRETTDKIIAIGASTGGTTALEYLFERLTPEVPGIVVVQHMPEKFTRAFANRLNQICEIEIREAENGDRLRNGLVLIAPGNRHMQLGRTGAHYFVEVRDGPIVNHHRPSVDVLFRSVARTAGTSSLGVILTGMGNDGTAGMVEMKKAGAVNIAQDEDSSVVYGMPREAAESGAVDQILPLEEIPGYLMKHWKLR